MNDLTTINTQIQLGATQAQQLVATFLTGKKETTVRAYTRDFAHFADAQGIADPNEAVLMLVEAGQGEANVAAHRYRAHMIEQGLAPATINRRLAALRSVLKLARTFALIDWALDVPNVPARNYRDTSGPGTGAFVDMLNATDDLRDRAILRLLFDVALRRQEVVTLDLEHVLARGDQLVLEVAGKGKWERTHIALPPQTAEALTAWIESRGTEAGPLFVNRDRSRKGATNRLSGTSVYRIVQAAAKRAGVKATVSPHRLRHSAITRAAELLKGDMRKLQQYSRHSDIRTAAIYIDNKADVAAKVAVQVASTSTCQGCGTEIAEGFMCEECK